MATRKQFIHKENGVCRLLSEDDAFVPEMSLPIKDILQQFAFIDNVRLVDMAKRGFEFASKDENDFDVEEFDRLDLAERDEIAANAQKIIDRYNELLAAEARNKPVDDEGDALVSGRSTAPSAPLP